MAEERNISFKQNLNIFGSLHCLESPTGPSSGGNLEIIASMSPSKPFTHKNFNLFSFRETAY